MKKVKKNIPENGATDQAQTFFIIGTVGELTLAEYPKRQCTFELIPDEEMKTMRNGKDGYLWLSSDVDANGVGQAITRYGKVVNIDFTENSGFLRLLIAAKVNAMKIRVEVQNVVTQLADASCKCKCSAHPQKCAHAEEVGGKYPQACAISLM